MTQRDRKGERQLGDRSAVDAGGPSQLDAAPRYRRNVDGVEPDAVLADHFQFGQLLEDAIVDALEADDRAIVTTQERDQRIAVEPVRRVHERDIRVLCLQLGAKRRVPRKRSGRNGDSGRLEGHGLIPIRHADPPSRRPAPPEAGQANAATREAKPRVYQVPWRSLAGHAVGSVAR
jgi:hypothetical protein